MKIYQAEISLGKLCWDSSSMGILVLSEQKHLKIVVNKLYTKQEPLEQVIIEFVVLDKSKTEIKSEIIRKPDHCGRIATSLAIYDG